MSLKKVLNVLKKNHSFLISAHVNLEGDALGSELALARLLKKQGKKVYVVNQDKAPLLYDFMPDIRTIQNPGSLKLDFDVAMIVYCTDLERIGSVKKLIGKGTPVVNIDHHISNNKFGDVKWVNPNASSASEMVYQIYKQGGFKLDREAALLLYTGIMIDTGSFRYSNTNTYTHSVIADLLKYKLSVEKIHNQVYSCLPLKEIKLLTRLLTGFKIDKSKKIVWLTLRCGVINEENMKTDVTEYVFDFLRSIAGIEVAMIFREVDKNKVRVNFRSNGRVNVSRLAGKFGGGGHLCASGCTVIADLKTAQRLVLSSVRKAL
ncbi:MAG: bifunctional oligoribonuclease/PAP phosphatase NrnA [Candidatus Omnitrophota bacterium]|nr:bifunctional oligoribonuclease/PAP phosphatase NrnA [Candidatus Omnitrophota bacterium]